MNSTAGPDPFALFGGYMQVTGVPRLAHAETDDPGLRGKSLGLINGSSWITLWSSWFGRRLLPGVKLVNAGNEAVQLSFMAAHGRGEPVPPAANIEAFARTAVDLVSLYPVDAILVTCSTMNRAWPAVQEAVRPWGVPVVQIDQPMMERAVATGKRILAVATHGPTVENTRALLEETAQARGARVEVECAITEEAFHLLGEGDIRGHNEAIARLLREHLGAARMRGPGGAGGGRADKRGAPNGGFDAVVLAQLSMSVFALSFPDPVATFGVPVLTSGEEGFRRAGEVLRAAAARPPRR